MGGCRSFTFDALAGQPYSGLPIEIQFSSPAGTGWVGIDNVAVTSTFIPEPSTIVLMGTGLLGLLGLCMAQTEVAVWRSRQFPSPFGERGRG